MKVSRYASLQTLIRFLFAMGILAATIRPARAVFVTLSAGRDVNAQAMANDGTPVVNSESPSSTGVFSQSENASVTGFSNDVVTSMASQDSTVPSTGSLITASGSASFSSTITDGSTGSVYNLPPSDNNFPTSNLSMLFSVSTPQEYAATITLSSSLSGNPGLFANTDVILIAYAPDNGQVFGSSAPATGLTFTGVLTPGVYEFDVFSEVGNEAPLTTNEFVNSSFTVSLQVTPTPEPGTMALGCLASAGLAVVAVRRRRCQTAGISRTIVYPA